MDILTSSIVFLLISLVTASYKDHSKVKVQPGEDVTLQCDGPKDATITLLEWMRPDLHSEGYVFFYRDERLYDNYLHPSFVDRVELRDPQMKDGDVSVILKNVTNNDTGTYECSVSVSKSSRRKRATPDFSKTIELVVEDSGDTGELTGTGPAIRKHVAWILPFIAVIVLVLGILIKRKTQNSYLSPDEVQV